MELIVEEISRAKKLIGRHKFVSQQLSIGRGYNNDIILSDPHVCADHLVLKAVDDQWVIQDLDSLNGTMLLNENKLTQPQLIESGDIIQIGKTQLRFMLPNHPVAESVKFSTAEILVENIGRWPVIITMLSLFTALNILFMYLNTPTKEINYNSLFLWGLGLTLGYALWPLFCSLMSHLNKHETRIADQLGVSFVIINLFWINEFIEVFLGFNLSSSWYWQWLIIFLSFALTCMMFWFNFYIAFTQSAKRRIKLALGCSTFIFASLFVYDLSNQPDFKGYPEYNSTIMPPAFAFSSASTPEEFIRNSDDLFKAVDKKAQQQKD